MSDDLDRSWWNIREDAYRLLEEAQEHLAGETMTSDQLDDITASVKSCHETIRIADKHLGLTGG